MSYRNSIGERKHEGKEGRPLAGDARPAGAGSSSSRSIAWVGRFATHRANHKRNLPGQAGIALPFVAPDGAGGVGHVALGRIREQSPGKILPPDQSRTTPAQNRN